jgi:anti-sigma regulatory factor (Ser/Thr protein kinase)
MELKERRLTIPATLTELEGACNFVGEAAHAAGLDEDGVYHCHLSVEEACTNVIEHGYRFDSANNIIDIICQPHVDRFTITIIDDAPPFNPLMLPEPDPSAPLWERQGGGWGVYFVKQYMDRVSYHYEGKRNHLILEKMLNKNS